MISNRAISTVVHSPYNGRKKSEWSKCSNCFVACSHRVFAVEKIFQFVLSNAEILLLIEKWQLFAISTSEHHSLPVENLLWRAVNSDPNDSNRIQLIVARSPGIPGSFQAAFTASMSILFTSRSSPKTADLSFSLFVCSKFLSSKGQFTSQKKFCCLYSLAAGSSGSL